MSEVCSAEAMFSRWIQKEKSFFASVYGIWGAALQTGKGEETSPREDLGTFAYEAEKFGISIALKRLWQRGIFFFLGSGKAD